MGLHRIGHDGSDLAAAAAYQLTPPTKCSVAMMRGFFVKWFFKCKYFLLTYCWEIFKDGSEVVTRLT